MNIYVEIQKATTLTGKIITLGAHVTIIIESNEGLDIKKLDELRVEMEDLINTKTAKAIIVE